MASLLPEELVQEILVRLPPDEPVNLVRASLVCKTWRRVLLNHGSFLRRCREVHGGAPPLLGYIRNRYYNDPLMGFVLSATSNASPLRMPAVDVCSGWRALDCRHGRVLILDIKANLSKRLVVLDPIIGTQQHLRVPPYFEHATSSTYFYAGAAVLCAEDEGCDHLDCHGGPFMVVIVQAEKTAIAETTIFTWASIYSSKTGDWSVPTSCIINHPYFIYSPVRKQSLLIGDALYFFFESGKRVIIKYDLHGHCLSEIDMPQDVNGVVTLMMNEDGGLEFVTLLNNCIYLWSRQDVTNGGIGGWVKNRVMEIETLVPWSIKSYEVIGFVEGTTTLFIRMPVGVFMLDIKSKTLRKFGETNCHMAYPILPYVSFYVPR